MVRERLCRLSLGSLTCFSPMETRQERLFLFLCCSLDTQQQHSEKVVDVFLSVSVTECKKLCFFPSFFACLEGIQRFLMELLSTSWTFLFYL